jgi:hypothetical protein
VLGVWRECGPRSGDGCSSKSVGVVGMHVGERVIYAQVTVGGEDAAECLQAVAS